MNGMDASLPTKFFLARKLSLSDRDAQSLIAFFSCIQLNNLLRCSLLEAISYEGAYETADFLRVV